ERTLERKDTAHGVDRVHLGRELIDLDARDHAEANPKAQQLVGFERELDVDGAGNADDADEKSDANRNGRLFALQIQLVDARAAERYLFVNGFVRLDDERLFQRRVTRRRDAQLVLTNQHHLVVGQLNQLSVEIRLSAANRRVHDQPLIVNDAL